jgi:hypothetical protein
MIPDDTPESDLHISAVGLAGIDNLCDLLHLTSQPTRTLDDP